MPLLKWKPEYAVDKVELDGHHIILFDVLNTAYENVMNSSEVNCVQSLVNDLSEYTRCHFVAEEQHMKEKEYPEIDAHIAQHRQFTQNIEKLKTNQHENNLEATKELIIVLGNWILNHILIEDRKYSDLPGQE